MDAELGRRRRSRLALRVGVACLLAFVAVTVIVVGRAGNAVDDAILHASPGTEHWGLARLMMRVRELGQPNRAGPLAALLIVAGLVFRRTRRVTLLAAAVFVSGVAVGTLLKYGLGQSGPPVVDGPPVDNGTAFPSGHTLLASLLYPCAAAVVATVVPRRLLPVLVAGAIGVPLAVGSCQILLRTHWFSDVVAAWLLAVAWLCLAAGAVDRLLGSGRGRHLRTTPEGRRQPGSQGP